MRAKHVCSAIAVAAMALAGLVSVTAQQTAFRRVPLQNGDLSVPGREAVMARAEIPPGVSAGRHTHAGEELGYVLEGTPLIEVQGKPAMTLKPGDVFFIPAGTPHNATNNGSTMAKILATYIVEKGKPLATPAP